MQKHHDLNKIAKLQKLRAYDTVADKPIGLSGRHTILTIVFIVHVFFLGFYCVVACKMNFPDSS